MLLSLFLLTAVFAYPDDLQRQLHDNYLNKTLVLRGFYSGAHLRFDSSGSLVGGNPPGDWTSDGFVLITTIDVKGHEIRIKARRMSALSLNSTFSLRIAENEKVRPGENRAIMVEIAADLGKRRPSGDQAEAPMAKIFLSDKDDFVSFIPDYWKPCVPAGLARKDENCQDRFRDLVPDYWKYCIQDALSDSDEHCHFAKEFMAIPGFVLGERYRLWDGLPRNPPSILGPRFSPPRPLSLDRSCLTDSARQDKYRGVVDFQVVIDSEGQPSKTREFSVRSVSDWMRWQRTL